MQRILSFRKNNKGDTLIIVIVGVLLLGILTSVVLASTTLNYSMKNIDRGQKVSFYNAEQAIDEIYAGVGEDVMNGMKYAYTYVLNNMMSKNNEGMYITNDNVELNKQFRNVFFYYLTGKESNGNDLCLNWNNVLYGTAANGIAYECNPYYKNGNLEQQNLKTHLQSFVDNGTSTAVVEIPEYTVENPNTAISFSTKVVSTESGNDVTIDCFTIKDVRVTVTTAAGVTSKVSTDINVEVPVVEINFSEVSTIDYGELFKYTILAEGDATNTDPTMEVISDTTIMGNVYAGKEDSSHKKGIMLFNADINAKSGNFFTSGDIDVYNAKFNIGRMPSGDPLKLWAKNIVTTGLDDVINIENADCVVKDDLEIRGNNSSVVISGNYFGFGFRGSDTSNTIEADSQENDKLYFNSADKNVFDANGNLVGTLTEYEHEKSSAVVVNGRDASLDLFDLNTLLIGGRAYVDLIDPDAGLGEHNSTYMTGESITIRGNQEAYLAGLNDEDLFNFQDTGDGYSSISKRNIVTSNPISFTFFRDNVLGKNILTDKAVAKKVGNSVYIYHASLSPVYQTKLFEDYFSSSSENKSEIRDKATRLGVKLIGIDESRTNIMSVGAIMKIDANKSDSQKVLMLNHNVENGNNSQFGRYITDLRLRYKAMMTEIKDYGDILTTTVPSNLSGAISSSTKTPIPTYIDVEMFNKVFDGAVANEDISNLRDLDGDGNMDTYIASLDILSATELVDLSFTDYNITNNNSHVVLTKVPNYVINGAVSNGIVIAANDVTVEGNFTGIIMCSGNIKVGNGVNGVKVTACPELAKWLATTDTTLNACMKGYLSTAEDGEGEASGHVSLNDIKYQDLVSYSNWQKLAVNSAVDESRH